MSESDRQPFETKRPVHGVMVKLLRHRRDDRGMTLIEPQARCVRAGELHELVTTDQDGGPGDTIDRVGFLGFVEIEAAGVIERGDPVWVAGRTVGTVLGFDESHFPNHYNVVIASGRTLTADDLGLAPEDAVGFNAPPRREKGQDRGVNRDDRA